MLLGAGGRAEGRYELGATVHGRRGQPPPGGGTGVGASTRGRAETSEQRGEGVGTRVNVEGEEGGPGGRLEGGGVAVFSLSTVKTFSS